jgi:hypothetical protein
MYPCSGRRNFSDTYSHSLETVDANKFKAAFEDAQKTNAELFSKAEASAKVEAKPKEAETGKEKAEEAKPSQDE